MNLKLADKVVWVLGASQGLGAACVRAFVEEGARVLATARSEDKLQELCQQVGADKCKPLSADLSDLSSHEALIDTACRETVPDIVVFCWNGMFVYAKLHVTPWEELAKYLQSHLLATVSLSQHILKRMLPARKGHLTFISSLTTQVGAPASGAYMVAKAGIESLSKSIAIDYAARHITSNSILPGPIEGERLSRRLSESSQNNREVAQDRATVNEESLAKMVCFFSSPLAQSTSGTSILVPELNHLFTRWA